MLRHPYTEMRGNCRHPKDKNKTKQKDQNQQGESFGNPVPTRAMGCTWLKLSGGKTETESDAGKEQAKMPQLFLLSSPLTTSDGQPACPWLVGSVTNDGGIWKWIRWWWGCCSGRTGGWIGIIGGRTDGVCGGGNVGSCRGKMVSWEQSWGWKWWGWWWWRRC